MTRKAPRRRRCDACGQLVTFVCYIQRDGFGMRVCEADLRRGDKVFHGRGKNDYTTHTYQTGAN